MAEFADISHDCDDVSECSTRSMQLLFEEGPVIFLRAVKVLQDVLKHMEQGYNVYQRSTHIYNRIKIRNTIDIIRVIDKIFHMKHSRYNSLLVTGQECDCIDCISEY